MSVGGAAPVVLVLGEMFSARIANALREQGHSVVAVVEEDELRAMTDDDLFAWVAARRCWLLTENVKDFRPILLRALQSGGDTPGLLFTSVRAFRRTRQNPGPLIKALDVWLAAGPPAPPVTEDWLLGPEG